ncbi:MAG: radical SAM protein [Candidatus Omnitrophota bacterium]|nr:radical SAM protein [Candidatus Omnitrophota bacterium]
MKIKKAFLIYPPTGLYMRDDRCQAPVKGMAAQPIRTPLDLAYIASTLENVGVECKIKDYPSEKQGWPNFEEDLKKFKPDVLVISVTTPTLVADLTAASLAKRFKNDILVISKGAHYLVEDEEVLKKFQDLDIIIRGESEFTVAEIVSSDNLENVLGITFRKNGLIKRTPNRPLLENLDSLPFPARHLLNNELYLTPDTKEPITLIYTGRGCFHQCVFCAVPFVAGHKVKLRSPQIIVSEIEECIKKYNIRNFFFRADTFTWDEKWVIEICKLIIDKDIQIRWGTNSRVDTINENRLHWMKKAGCWVIGFGVESGNQESLDLMKKKTKVKDAFRAISLCKRYGIKTYALFVIGFPWEKRSDIKDTIRLTKALNPSFIDINIAYPLPGTELFRLAKKENLFNEKDLHGYDYAKPLIRTKYLTTKELINLRRWALLSFYLRPSYIARTLLSIRSPKILFSYITSGIQLIYKTFSSELHVEEFREEM